MKTSENVPVFAVVLLAFLCLLWGANMLSINLSNQGFAPMLAVTIRSVIASALLATYACFMGERVFLERRNFIHGIGVGLIFGLEFLVLYLGIAYTPVSRAVIFLYTQPLWTALGAHFLLGERLTPVKMAGLGISFTGLALVFGVKTPDLPEYYRFGDALELLAGFLWAATTIYIKRFISVFKHISHYQTLFAQLFFAIPVLALGWLLFERHIPVTLAIVPVSAILYQSVIVAFLSYLAWFRLIHTYDVVKLSAFTFLAPLFGVLLGGLVLKEELTVRLLVGLFLAAVGIYLVNKR